MVLTVKQRHHQARSRPVVPDRIPTDDWSRGYEQPTDAVLTVFRTGRPDAGVDSTGLALLVQQNTQMASDLAAMRVDVAKVAVQVAAIPDMETRLRAIEQRPSTVDIESRLRQLERWRYALPVSAILAAGSIVGSLIEIFHG